MSGVGHCRRWTSPAPSGAAMASVRITFAESELALISDRIGEAGHADRRQGSCPAVPCRPAGFLSGPGQTAGVRERALYGGKVAQPADTRRSRGCLSARSPMSGTRLRFGRVDERDSNPARVFRYVQASVWRHGRHRERRSGATCSPGPQPLLRVATTGNGPSPQAGVAELAMIVKWWMSVGLETITDQGWQNGRSRSETITALNGHNGHMWARAIGVG
jgi:hypothetical protein